MSVFRCGKVDIPREIVNRAHKIKHQNHHVYKPGPLQVKEKVGINDHFNFFRSLGGRLQVDPATLDMVLFSCREGAEPHVDSLLATRFHSHTWIIPVILPAFRETFLKCEDRKMSLMVSGIYLFDHTKLHSIEVTQRSVLQVCVVLMIAERRTPRTKKDWYKYDED